MKIWTIFLIWSTSVPFKKIIRWIGYTILVVLVSVVVIVGPQDAPPVIPLSGEFYFDFPDTLAGRDYDWDSIRARTGPCQEWPPDYAKAAMIALTAYPELSSARIHFVLTDGGAPMETNFRFWTLLLPRARRVYEIRLNDARPSMFEGVLMRNLPFDAQVGILAHELGHVVYYERMTTLQIAKWALMYLISPGYRADHEKHTDRQAIYSGLGSQLYQYAWFIRHDEQNIEMYDKWGAFIDRFYLTDQEIKAVLDSLDATPVRME